MQQFIKWRQYPFVRLIFPFAAGIVAADRFSVFTYSISWILFLLLLLLLVFVQYFRRKPGYSWADGSLLFVLVFFLGTFTYRIHEPQRTESYFKHHTPPDNQEIIVRIDDLDLTPNWFKIYGTVVNTLDSGLVWHNTTGKILVYAARDSSTLSPGNLIYVASDITEVPSARNPDAFDYKTYLKRKGILTQVFARKGEWSETGKSVSSLAIFASKMRLRLVQLIKEYIKPERENAVASALLLGYRNDLTDELNNAYINTGSIHILAVSGMHVGLVSGMLMLLLNFIKRNNRTIRIVKLVIILAFIWFFVMLTGAGASVVRAAVMFSFIHTGYMLMRRRYIYNTIAASSFVIFLWNPQMIFDVGFHLSLAAVLGIISLQPFLNGLYWSENKIISFAWELTSITLAAQLTTLPIALYYFHQTSLYFLISGIVVVPISSIALYAGVGLAVFHWILPVLAKISAFIMYGSLFVMNSVIYAIAGLPYNLVTDIPFNGWEFVLLSAAVVLAIFFISLRRKIFLFTAIGCFLAFGIARITFNSIHSKQQKLIFYNSKADVFVDYFDGNKCISIRQNSNPDEEKYVASGARMAARILETKTIGLNDSYTDFYRSSDNTIRVKNYVVKFLLKNSEKIYGIDPGTCVYVAEDVSDEVLTDHIFPEKVFIGSNVGYKIRKKWKQYCESNKLECIDLKNESSVVNL